MTRFGLATGSRAGSRLGWPEGAVPVDSEQPAKGFYFQGKWYPSTKAFDSARLRGVTSSDRSQPAVPQITSAPLPARPPDIDARPPSALEQFRRATAPDRPTEPRRQITCLRSHSSLDLRALKGVHLLTSP